MRTLLLVLLLSVPVLAPAAVTVADAWVRAMPPVAKNSAGYLRLSSDGAADELLGATLDGVRVVELHEMRAGADGSRGMFRLPAIAVPAAGSVTLAPGGMHLMLIDLQKPLVADTEIGGVLRFRDAGEVPVRFRVRAN